MNLIELKCSTCGANLDVDPSSHVFECTYCGTTNVIDADTITINKHVNSATLDFEREYNLKIQNGEYLMNELKNYEKAFDIFYDLYEISKNDLRLLEGLMVSCSHGFNHKKVQSFWLFFEEEYNKYLEAYSKLQKDPIKVAYYENEFNKMKNKAMGNVNSTKLLIFIFIVVFIIAFYVAFVA